ncbi:MAG: rhodanese-like domain-containing protein [Chlorobi bacterium]|nr:MAG: rhodanese-like domain-containing protein [Bacteroidota bacterium]KXK35751.1 MAG: rhodanese-related sulfurtransferase [Chlorobi bacterium OLB6]MBE2265287.1 rhodanese-like domain-containing protein [Flavobacteriales bacterium]MBL1160250.1 rhodanese-like domain-containing protein [Chlorobiota bacterium]MBW7853388.1 rhodanese-like domain-containing protein [Candidatus Kapabacteria bacterium]MCC6330435.1 rhodanese-like domain-containing protein [Ignavibacteria bacterium]
MTNLISTDVLKRRIENSEELIILDVRTNEEWDEFHLPGAIHIPLHELESRLSEIECHKDCEIIVYCRSGGRSGQACMFLELSGFCKPVNLKGGISAW